MATLTFSLTSGPFTGTRNVNLSDEDVTRWLNALRDFAVTQGIENPTDAQLLIAWVDHEVKSIKAMVRSHETSQALATINDIGVT